MAQPFSLQTVLEVMQTRSDEATRKLGQLIAAEQNQRSRLSMLEQYREEYAERLRAAVMEGVTPHVLLNYQDFLGRIDAAIAQQRDAVRNSEKNTQAGQEHWKHQNKQLKAMDTLSQRHFAKERHKESKQDQKLQDEFSSRQFGSQSSFDDPDT